MEVFYDKSLIEDVVFREIKRREAKGQDSIVEEYYKEHQSIYERCEELRERSFERLHESFFLKFGFANPLLKILSEFEEFTNKINTIIIFKALTPSEEEASLNYSSNKIGFKIYPEHFFDQENFEAFLRHELKHISDMMDLNFGYKREGNLGDLSPAQENVIHSRYKVIWDIFIDGRIQRNGKGIILPKEKRFLEFEALYRTIPDSGLHAIFETLWSMERMTHDEILAMAKDSRTLIDKTLNDSIQGEFKEEYRMLPGSLCPLCKFPTFNWCENLLTEREKVLARIKTDFPSWNPDQGACERCVEVYSIKDDSK